MNRIRFPLLFAFAAGAILSAAICQAASPYGSAAGYSSAANSNSSGSQLTLVSATEDQPQAADPSSVRLADPRGTSAPTQQAPAPSPTRSAAPRSSTSTAKPSYQTSRSAAAPTRQPVQRAVALRPGEQLPARQTRPTYYSARNNVQLTAHVDIDPTVPSRPETVMRPGAPPSPEFESSAGECPTCSMGCGSELCNCQSCCGFCAGMDYLYLRPHFADDGAYEQSTVTTTTTTVTQDNRLINFDEPYSSDYHLFLGYHNACGDEFRVGFWHLADDGNRSGVVTGDFLAGAGVAFQAPGGTELTAAGQTINATSHMRLNLYDFEDYKRLDLPSLGIGCCPAWDVRWSFGMRFIDFKHTVDIFDPIETINDDAYFVGGGPKVGLEVRRQLGHSNFALFVNTSAALLLGEGRNRSTTTTPGIFQTAVDMNIANAMEKIPDYYIQFGVEWKPWCNTTLTAGWMLEDFGNLGTAGATTCTTCSTTSGQIGGGDLSFDGLFVRAEHCF